MRLKQRLRIFMERHNLTHEEMAEKITTPYGTLRNWMLTSSDSRNPPACMCALLDILEQSGEARRIVGIKE